MTTEHYAEKKQPSISEEIKGDISSAFSIFLSFLSDLWPVYDMKNSKTLYDILEIIIT